MKRITHHDYFFKVVEAIALRGSCDRGRSGAVMIKQNRIVATGYVGSPAGTPHCDEIGHEMEKHDTTKHCVRTIHSELNAILQAARYGPPLNGAELYCTMFPCYSCAKAIVSAGIVAVHAWWDYQKSERSKELFNMVKISWSLELDELKPYFTQG